MDRFKRYSYESIFSLKVNFVEWEEIVKVEQVNLEKSGVTKPDHLVLHFKMVPQWRNLWQAIWYWLKLYSQ